MRGKLTSSTWAQGLTIIPKEGKIDLQYVSTGLNASYLRGKMDRKQESTALTMILPKEGEIDLQYVSTGFNDLEDTVCLLDLFISEKNNN
jgi:hypothetical protein